MLEVLGARPPTLNAKASTSFDFEVRSAVVNTTAYLPSCIAVMCAVHCCRMLSWGTFILNYAYVYVHVSNRPICICMNRMMQLRKTPPSRYIDKAGKFKIYDYCFSCSNDTGTVSMFIHPPKGSYFTMHTDTLRRTLHRLSHIKALLRTYLVPPLCIV